MTCSETGSTGSGTMASLEIMSAHVDVNARRFKLHRNHLFMISKEAWCAGAV